MATITLTPLEVLDYKNAIDIERELREAFHPFMAPVVSECGNKILRRRGISGYVENVTVTYRGDGLPPIFEMIYSDAKEI